MERRSYTLKKSYAERLRIYTEAHDSIGEQIEAMMDSTGLPRAYCTIRILRKPENKEMVQAYLEGHPGNRTMEDA